MQVQLRRYRILTGQADQFVREWRDTVAPLREKHGFRVKGWLVEDSDEFVWLLEHGDRTSFEAANDAYYASAERQALGPDPARLIAEARKDCAREWQCFFEARRTDPGDTDLARSLWADAEQTTTEFAHDLVGEGSEREEIFLEQSDVWRKTLRASNALSDLDFCEWEWCEPAIFVADPRSYGEVRFGADVMWREAGLEAWLPDWLTD
jgi:hypothetical protein